MKRRKFIQISAYSTVAVSIPLLDGCAQKPVNPAIAQPQFLAHIFDAKTMLRELRVFYDANGISALNFHCKHHAICSGGSPAFITAQETYVGPDYMTGPLPRLLFLSLDSGKLKPEPEARTMEAVRQRTIARDVNDLHKGNHWYQTHALALELLARPSIRRCDSIAWCATSPI